MSNYFLVKNDAGEKIKVSINHFTKFKVKKMSGVRVNENSARKIKTGERVRYVGPNSTNQVKAAQAFTDSLTIGKKYSILASVLGQKQAKKLRIAETVG